MTLVRLLLLLLAILLLPPAAAWSQDKNVIYLAPPGDEDPREAQWLAEGVRLVKAGRHAEALLLYFQRVASAYESRYNDKGTTYFSVRDPA